MSPVPLSRGDTGAWNSIESGQPLVCILEQTGGTGERRGTPAMHRHEAREKFVQSKTLFAQKRYPEALIVLDGLNAAFPNEKHIMLARAMCLAELQRPLEAIQICEQAVTLHNDPKSQELLVRLRREHGPIQEGPTDLASLLGRGAGGGVPSAPAGYGGLPGIPDIPAVPDLSMYGPPPRSSGKRFYIVLGSVAAVLALLLIGLPLVLSMTKKGDGGSGTIEVAVTEQGPTEGTAVAPAPAEPEAPAAAAGAVVQPVQWYYSVEQGSDVAYQYGRPICLFYYDSGQASSAIEASVFQDPAISQALSQFINIRVLYAEDDPTPAEYGITQVPAIVVEDTTSSVVYMAQGAEIVPEELRSALSGVQVTQATSGSAPFGEGVSVLMLVVLVVAGLLAAPWPLYLTLLFTGKLPHGEFLKDIFSVGLVAIGANAVAGIVPCFGIFVLVWILSAVYDMGFFDFLIYFALNAVTSVLLALLLVAIFGAAMLSALPALPSV